MNWWGGVSYFRCDPSLCFLGGGVAGNSPIFIWHSGSTWVECSRLPAKALAAAGVKTIAARQPPPFSDKPYQEASNLNQALASNAPGSTGMWLLCRRKLILCTSLRPNHTHETLVHMAWMLGL